MFLAITRKLNLEIFHDIPLRPCGTSRYNTEIAEAFITVWISLKKRVRSSRNLNKKWLVLMVLPDMHKVYSCYIGSRILFGSLSTMIDWLRAPTIPKKSLCSISFICTVQWTQVFITIFACVFAVWLSCRVEWFLYIIKNLARGKLCEIVLAPKFQNFIF